MKTAADDTTSSFPDDAPRPGDVIDGKYRVECMIGSGGMGYVLAADHLQLQERVAIKLLLRGEASRPEGVARFLREARASVKIRSEHVVRVLDVGDDHGRPYIVMEFLRGSDLAAIIERRGRLPSAVAVDYVLQACEALAEAHTLGIVHRDLKPANLFVTQLPDGSDCVKVLDFGISKMLDAGPGAVAMTVTSATIGTPLYMSPEQLKSSKNVDPRTDLWSVGVILFELLVGRRPFVADSLAELGAQVLREDAPDVRSLGPDIPVELAAAIASCLRRDLNERVKSVADLAVALAPFGTEAGRRSSRAIVNVLAQGSTPRLTAAVQPVDEQSATVEATTDLPRLALTDATWTEDARAVAPAASIEKRRGRPVVGALVGGAAVLLLAGGAALIARGALRRPAETVTPLVSAATDAVSSSSPALVVLPPPAEASAAAPLPIAPPAETRGASPAPSASAARAASTGAPPRAKPALRPSASAHASAVSRSPSPLSSPSPSPKGLDGFSTNRHD